MAEHSSKRDRQFTFLPLAFIRLHGADLLHTYVQLEAAYGALALITA